MSLLMRSIVAGIAACFLVGTWSHAESPLAYRFTFPEPHHHWMQVEVSLTQLAVRPLELRMSRASPGRYSLHDFVANVYDVHAYGENGRELPAERPDPYGWTIREHPATVTVRYKVFGDFLDGTYLAVDTSHAHINMPAAIMWARGLDDRPVTVTLAEPEGRRWRVATQLHPAGAPLTFSAPNLQYLMDSPIEFGPLTERQFSAGGRTFRFAAHQTDTTSELDALVADVQKVVRTEGEIFGEFPAYESGAYTFIADYLPYAGEDGMEHRNSTVMTSAGSIRTDRFRLLETAAHEFFHSWNVERIRPRSLEPFDLERANASGELWLAEGFTEYYAPLVLSRSGLADLHTTLLALNGYMASVTPATPRRLGSAVEMSRMATFTDGATRIDRTNWSTTVISYYQFGAAIGLALDLSLRDRTDSRVTLDDYMRAMWRAHGKPGGSREGYVDRPYTLADAEARLAEVSDASFARDFFARYIEGHDVADYERLLARAGLALRRQHPGRAWWGDLQLDTRGGSVRITEAPAPDWPAYTGGLDVGDEIRQLDRTRVGAPGDVTAVLQRHRPGDRLSIVFADRSGSVRNATVILAEDRRMDLVAVEGAGGVVTASQKSFRERWLGRAN